MAGELPGVSQVFDDRAWGDSIESWESLRLRFWKREIVLGVCELSEEPSRLLPRDEDEGVNTTSDGELKEKLNSEDGTSIMRCPPCGICLVKGIEEDGWSQANVCIYLN